MSKHRKKTTDTLTHGKKKRAACTHVKYVYMPTGKAMHTTSTHELILLALRVENKAVNISPWFFSAVNSPSSVGT